MVSLEHIYDELKESLDPNAAKKIADVIWVVFEELKNSVTKVEFKELRDIVKDLAEAQKRTEIKVEELAEAQKRTEIRLDSLTQKVEELAEAQKRTEIKVEELAEAQKRTEIRLDSLTQKMSELAEAQKKTEISIQGLTKEFKDMKKQMGGITDTIGYTLENASYKALPKLLKRDFGMTVKGRLFRQYITDNKNYEIEVNIVGEATKTGKIYNIIGESKSQLSKNGIDDFVRKKINRVEGIYENIFPVLVTHMVTDRSVQKYAKEKGIAIYFSYDF